MINHSSYEERKECPKEQTSQTWSLNIFNKESIVKYKVHTNTLHGNKSQEMTNILFAIQEFSTTFQGRCQLIYKQHENKPLVILVMNFYYFSFVQSRNALGTL